MWAAVTAVVSATQAVAVLLVRPFATDTTEHPPRSGSCLSMTSRRCLRTFWRPLCRCNRSCSSLLKSRFASLLSQYAPITLYWAVEQVQHNQKWLVK